MVWLTCSGGSGAIYANVQTPWPDTTWAGRMSATYILIVAVVEDQDFRRSRAKRLKGMAGTTGLEPAASAVTGQRSNQLNYVPAVTSAFLTDGGQCRARTCDLLLVRQAL